jgi:amino acid transporter
LILRLLFISELLGVTAAARVFLIIIIIKTIIIIIIIIIILIFEKWEGADTTRAMYRRNESAREI